MRKPTQLTVFASCTCLILVGCGGRYASIAPEGLEPGETETVRAWVDEFIPSTSRIYTVRPWRYQNEQGAAAGRAVIRIAPPDSLRFDYRGPFGRSGRAAVVGDSVLWVSDDDFEGLVQMSPIFWTALGMPPEPPSGGNIFVLENSNVRAWRYVVAGDTLNFVLEGNPAIRIRGEIRRAGRTIGLVDVEMNPETGWAVRSQVDFPQSVARFEFTIEGVDTLAVFDPSVWQQN